MAASYGPVEGVRQIMAAQRSLLHAADQLVADAKLAASLASAPSPATPVTVPSDVGSPPRTPRAVGDDPYALVSEVSESPASARVAAMSDSPSLSQGPQQSAMPFPDQNLSPPDKGNPKTEYRKGMPHEFLKVNPQNRMTLDSREACTGSLLM